MTSLGLSFLTGKMGTVRLAPSWQDAERTQEVMHVMHLLFKICIYFGCAGSSLLRRLFSSCREWGYSLVAVHGLLTAVTSLVAGHGLRHSGFSSCSS